MARNRPNVAGVAMDCHPRVNGRALNIKTAAQEKAGALDDAPELD